MPKDTVKHYPVVLISKERLFKTFEELDDLEEGYGTAKIVENIKNMDEDGMWDLAEKFMQVYEGDLHFFYGGPELFENVVLHIFSGDFVCIADEKV